MTKTGKAPARRPLESHLGKLADALLDGVRRVLEGLAPQPQPVPVRVRGRRMPPRDR